MYFENSFLKINIKGQGHSFIWFKPNSINENVLDSYLPKHSVNYPFGYNLAFNSIRMPQNICIVNTICTWNIMDEHGRIGLSLTHGLVIKEENLANSYQNACECLLALLSTHKKIYPHLGEQLQEISLRGTENDAKQILRSLIEGINLYEFTIPKRLITMLAHQINPNEKLRVNIEFPWNFEIGFCSLLVAQYNSSRVYNIGGGNIEINNSVLYQHISCFQDFPGFKYLDLNNALNSKNIVYSESSSRNKGMSKSVLNKITIYIFSIIILFLLLVNIFNWNSSKKELSKLQEQVAIVLRQNNIYKAEINNNRNENTKLKLNNSNNKLKLENAQKFINQLLITINSSGKQLTKNELTIAQQKMNNSNNKTVETIIELIDNFPKYDLDNSGKLNDKEIMDLFGND